MRRKFIGPAGEAVEQTLPAVPEDPAWTATLRSYFAHLPGQAAAWDKYQISVVHLRDIPGVRSAHKQFPEADYELMLCALDPTINPALDNFETQLPLSPINLNLQFAGTDDQLAIKICDLAAEAVVVGMLPVEPMFSCGPGTRHHELWKYFVEKVKAM